MRIGELSKQSGVPISTIRYYIQTGLLVPDSGNSQYVFDERDTQSLQRITQLKSWGLSLDNVHSILSMNRISGGVEKESYEECIELLRKHQKDLQSKCDLYQRYIKEIDEVIVPLQTKADALKNEKKIPHNTGVPVQALRLLCCPHCGNSLQISNADIDSNFLYKANSTVPVAILQKLKTVSFTHHIRIIILLINLMWNAQFIGRLRTNLFH